jgi:hypothetical protein
MHLALQRIFSEYEVVLLALPLETQSVQLTLLGKTKQSLSGRSLHAEDHKLYLSPIHLGNGAEQGKCEPRGCGGIRLEAKGLPGLSICC